MDEVTVTADRLQQELMQPIRLKGHEVFVTTSIGIVMSDPAYTQAEDILRDADTAMYHAKNRGKAQYAVFDKKMYTRAMERLRSEADLRRALERQEFALNYQPIVSATTGQILGFEALLRWWHPDRGFVSPAEFIPLAEETGLILPIGEWVLHEACRQLQEWHCQDFSYADLTISVNITSNQVAQPDLIETIRHALQETGLPPNSLKLEITESVIMENVERAAAKLSVLRELGIQVYIDDFGTGYSSFSYLQKLPVDALKIDQSFVNRLGSDASSVQIVQAIVTLARGLGIDVVAEGVETEEQFASLRAVGCDAIQGYLISKPLALNAATQFLVENCAEGDRLLAEDENDEMYDLAEFE
jgi:EAL domain-containing protein (putative c-di-GMP-specific phosphodiesterase class I)